MIKELSIKCGDYLARELSLDQRNRNITVFGLEVIIGGFIKTVTFISLALVFNIFFQLITVLMVYGTLRWTAGGVHCSSYSRCMVLSLVLMFGTALTGVNLAPYLDLEKLIIVSFLIGIIINGVYAPVAPPEKPIKSVKKRRLLKLTAIAQLSVYLLLFKMIDLPGDILACTCLAVLLESFTLSPWGMKFIHMVDTYMSRLGGRRCAT